MPLLIVLAVLSVGPPLRRGEPKRGWIRVDPQPRGIVGRRSDVNGSHDENCLAHRQAVIPVSVCGPVLWFVKMSRLYLVPSFGSIRPGLCPE